MRFLLPVIFAVASCCVGAQSAPDWKITAEPIAKLKANSDSDMRIKIVDGKGKPVAGAEVEMVLTMVDMDHGEHKTPAKMMSPGVYEGKANFFMVGGWNLEVRAKKGSQSKAQKIRIDVKE